MILAGPGSGKTTVIAWRLRYLIEEYGADPGSILVITFTRAAAVEMQYRFMKITDSSYPEVSFGTFHSIFYQIIRSSNLYRNSRLTIANESFKYEAIRDILARLKAIGKIKVTEYDEFLENVPDIISEISRIKNTGGTGADCSHSLCFMGCFPDIFELYGRRLMEFNMIDFDDMIIRCYELLVKDESALRFWREKYRFFLIDEYQDINLMQYKVIKLLSEGCDNVFAVGDDDQSIYGFRGSDPGIMLGFPDSFGPKKVRILELNTNYRCGKRILENALMVIGQNRIRFKKELMADVHNGEGAVIARRYESREKQNEQIALFLKKHRESLGDIAILFRTNSEAVALSKVLSGHGIPNNLDTFVESIYENEAVKLCTYYLSFACQGRKRSDFFRIMNHPMRYISRDSVSKDVVNQADIERFYRGNRDRIKNVRKLFCHINMISHLRPSLSVKYIRRSIGVDEMFPESSKILDEFEREAAFYEDMDKFLLEISQKARAERERNSERKGKAGKGNDVRLLTMHGSKGLEFEIVWIPDLNEGIIPSRSATSEKNIEEERRMLYVAMTRAKRALIMSYITGTKENPMLPTRFIRPVKNLWEKNYEKLQTSSEPSSGRSSGSSTSSSNSTSSR